MVDTVEHIDALWRAKWPTTPPLGSLLRVHHPDRWVRFHALPNSKRYPETAEEYATVVERHNAVLGELGASSECFVVWVVFSSDAAAAPTDGTFWQTVVDEEFLAGPAELFVRSLIFPSTALDNLLRSVAEEETVHVIVAPEDLEWLYHPYDGGADVIAPSSGERDRLKHKFETWLSDEPTGL